MEPAGHLETQDWMTAPETRAVMQALSARQTDVRFVGGCVRDALLGRRVTDVDIATPDEPARVIDKLKAAGIRSVPTGIEHGTVTAIVAHKPFEITTLRRDIETDGRRAVVAYTDDWQEDAARRDFTMNAIYCDADGTLYDPEAGLADIAARQVRFVGDPARRIEEDALRILRFYRFQARLEFRDVDGAGDAACKAAAAMLDGLSGERIAREMYKLLAARDPVQTLRIMLDGAILPHVVATDGDLDRLQGLCELEQELDLVDPVRRLGSLARDTDVAARWRLSNADRARLAALSPVPDGFGPAMTLKELRHVLYRRGGHSVIDWILLAWAEDVSQIAWRGHLHAARTWQEVALPVKGQDVLDLGVKRGPRVGEIVRDLENWWIEGDFSASRDQCLARLRDETGPGSS
jgi:poly(A) polymerase